MSYKTHSNHAPTGAASSAKFVTSPNEYAPEGRTIGYPDKFTLHVSKVSDVDGSTQINGEPHTIDQLVGNRLYLYHRPLVDPTGGIATITSSQGTVVQANTNAKQGYIEYLDGSTPTSDFTVSYMASSDCFSHWQQNTLQDDVMELQQKLGPSNQTGWPGIRNVSMAIFDTPNDDWNDLLPNLYSLPNLPANKNVRISSTIDDTLTGTLGTEHTIQIGVNTDKVLLEGTEITVGSQTLSNFSDIYLAPRTGDAVYYSGIFSGESQMTIGGPNSVTGGYSGVSFDADLTGSYYSGAMLRVHGDIAAMGDIKARGTLTLVHSTGETSTVLGDFTIRDELFVYGKSHLIGPTDTNDLHVQKDITLDGNLIAGNTKGAGERGHSLIDNLDASEVAHTYKPVTKKNLSNYIIEAPPYYGNYEPITGVVTANYSLQTPQLVGDEFVLTGFFTAAAGPSGEHPSILQLQWNSGELPYLSGYFTGVGGNNGKRDGAWFSRGMIDPGSLWIEIMNGQAKGYQAPIYGNTVEEIQGDYLTKLNVFTPQLPSQIIQATVDTFRLYSPGCEHFEYLSATNGANPTVTITANDTGPLWVAFEDEVRVFDSQVSRSLKTALEYSVSGLNPSPATPATGTAYVFASKNNVDIEANPDFVVRATPFRMPGETIIGEISASYDLSTWTVESTTSYRPGGKYDSSWIPIHTDFIPTSGRHVSKLNDVIADPNLTGNRFYFNHNLGADLTFSDVNAELYLGSYGGIDSTTINANKYHQGIHSLWGADFRHGVGLTGSFTRMPLTNIKTSDDRDTSVFYMDGRVIGIQINDNVLDAPVGNGTAFNYLRLIVQRTS